MKNRNLLLIIPVLLFLMPACNAQTTESNQADETVSSETVEVYYFHFTRRCATCQAVEDESEAALKDLYPEKVNAGEITFLSVNLEESENEPLAKKLNVSGQSLLLVKGEKQENLTNVAFMHARSNPEKLRDALKESIEKL